MVDRLAKQQACQLFIEQEIEKGLAEKKTTYQIGKEVAAWIQKLFQAKVRPETIEERARRQRIATNVATKSTQENQSEIQEIQEIKIKHGGARDGAGRPPKFAVLPDQAHFRTSFTGENEAYTPLVYIEAASKVMGSIDLDPASSEFGQERVKALKHYTSSDNALAKEWRGKIWMNPPYSQPLIYDFIKKAVDEYKKENIQEAIILTNNYTDTQWFHLAESVSLLLCFTKGRIKFEKQDGSIAAAMNGQTFFYWGREGGRFKEVFGKFGFIR